MWRVCVKDLGSLQTVSRISQQKLLTTARHSVRVLAAGNTIIDNVLSMPSIPVDDKIWIDSKRTYIGGQGANAAQGMALLGLQVSFLTRVGDDLDGEKALHKFGSLGIKTNHCIVVPGVQTMSACVTVATQDQTRSCLMHKDSKMFEYNARPALAEIDLSQFDVMYTDGHQLDLVLPIAKEAHGRGLPVLADVEVLTDESRELATLASELVAPAVNICALAGIQDPAAAALALAQSKEEFVVVATAGKEGSYGAETGDDEATYVSAENCNVLDTTGAGDAYHAGFMATHGKGFSLRERMAFATKVAAALCETPGPAVSKEALARSKCF
eukprot:TRINITY_DN112337_c0_g1_i1.p1 TRINITY_DN112337_c0_g1~~TRINITY_DN112337_c0_g1_i1.p1  ORF type:complete len:328 (+),score=60.09 TRINITY_DN112337_c0_g1_i1:59-1042(+)